MKKYIKYVIGLWIVTAICVKIIKGVGSDREPASVMPSAACQGVLDYYKTAGVNLVEDKKDQSKVPEEYRLAYSGNIQLQGPGIISSKQVSVMCSMEGNITIMGVDIKIDRMKAPYAIKTLAPIFLVQSSSLKSTDAQKKFFSDVGPKLQSDSEWKAKIENGYSLRLMTVQADSDGNYYLAVDAGNAR